VIVFFSPGAASLARVFNAAPCNDPPTDQLERLTGDDAGT